MFPIDTRNLKVNKFGKWIQVTIHLLATLRLSAIVTAQSPQRKLIVAGKPVKIEAMPHSVLVLISNRWPDETDFCSGSILNHRWVLTVAHCTRSISKDGLLKIRFGIDSYDQEGPISDVRKIVCHKGYRRDWIGKDICLLQTFNEIPFSDRVQPVALPLPEEKLDSVTDVRVAGWGFVEKTHLRQVTTVLLVADLPMIGLTECDAHFLYDLRLEDPGSIFCAGKETIDQSTCSGDSGSAAVIRRNDNKTWVAMGITVAGKCKGPAIFMPVPYYLDWINRSLSQHPSPPARVRIELKK